MITNAAEITARMVSIAIVERFAATESGKLSAAALKLIQKPTEAEPKTVIGKFGDHGRYVTSDDGARFFLTKDGEINRTGKNVDPSKNEPQLRAGQTLTVPPSTSFGEFSAKLTDEGGGKLGLRRNENDSYAIVKFDPVKMRVLLDDLNGKIRIRGTTGNSSIDKVGSGQAKFLGRGNDGLAFDTGDGNVVKASSQFFFHWMQGARTPQEAVEHTKRGYEIGVKLRQMGIPGIIPQEYYEHDGRAYLVMPKLDTSAKITPEHVEQVRQTVKGMLDAGYGLNDEIQVGIGQDGRAYVFDLGQANKIESKFQKENNEEAFTNFAAKHGVKDVDADAISKLDNTLEEAQQYIEKWEKRGYVAPGVSEPLMEKLREAWARANKADPNSSEIYEDAFFGLVDRLYLIPTQKPPAT